MPFIMLPTVDVVDESNKSPVPATGHSPTTEERRTTNSIFTRFSTKPDPLVVEDLTLGKQCGQQQQQTDGDEDGVCDLNRYSSPRRPTPSSLNVGVDQKPKRVQNSTLVKPSASLAPLLLLSPSDEMTMANAKTNGSLTTPTAADALFLGRTQIALVTLMRQLSLVTNHAGTVFQRLSTDIDKINEQSQRLKSRLQVLQVHADSLLGKKASKSNSPVGLVRYTNVKKHFRTVSKGETEDKEFGCRLFTPSTRSPVIVALYESADQDPSKKRRLSSSPAVEHCATQTEHIRSANGASQSLIRRGETLAVVSTNDESESTSKRVFRPSSTTNLVRQDSAIDDGLRRHLQQQQQRQRPGGEFGNETDAEATKSEISTTWKSRGQKCTTQGDGATNCGAIRPTQSSIAVINPGVISATVIAIDTSAGALRRASKQKKDGQYGEIVKRTAVTERTSLRKEPERETTKQRRAQSSGPNRRNTVVGNEIDSFDITKGRNTMAKSGADFQDGAKNGHYMDDSKIRPIKTEEFSGTTGDSIANEVVYEFAPFYRRKSRRLLTSANFFSSLRRPKKDKQILSPPVAVSTPVKNGTNKDDAVEYSSPYYSTKNEMSSSVHSDSIVMSPAIGELTDESARIYSNQKSGTNSAIKGLKQFFQRSASLRRSKRDTATQSPNTTAPPNLKVRSPPPPPPRFCVSPSREATAKSPDEEDVEDRSTSSSSLGFQRNYSWRPKTNLPISTTSQVIHVAAQLREHPTSLAPGTENDQRFSKLSSSSSRDSAYSSCGKKLRPPSVVSLASLDFTENKMNGWYRQGYQLEYPDECVREDTSLRETVPGKPTIPSTSISKMPIMDNSRIKARLCGQPTASRDTSNSSPYSDVSSFVDSNFSCDREGYFTTMHRDCGLKKTSEISTPSTDNSPPSLVTGTRQDTDGSSSSSLDTVTEPIVEIGARRDQTIPSTPTGQPNRCSVGIRRRPPDLSLPSSISMPCATGSPLPLSAASEAEIKFDLWLMSKFHAEQRMQQFRQQQKNVGVNGNCDSPRSDNGGGGNKFFSRNFGRFSLPRNKKEPNNNQRSKNGYVVDYLRSLGYGENELIQKQQQDGRSPTNIDNSCTMPRKTVRFCE